MSFNPLVAILGTFGKLLESSNDRYAKSQKEYNAYKLNQGQKKAATRALQGYGYNVYNNPYKSFFEKYINQYLSGLLTEAQKSNLAKANEINTSNVNTIMANRGATLGGHLAMQQKVDETLARQRLNMADANVNNGFKLAEYLIGLEQKENANKQNANMKYKELLARYAPNKQHTQPSTDNRGFITKLFGKIV